MAKTVKMVYCKKCNELIHKDAKICPHCGCKNKKSKKGWLIFLLIIIILGVFSTIRKDKENRENKIGQMGTESLKKSPKDRKSDDTEMNENNQTESLVTEKINEIETDAMISTEKQEAVTEKKVELVDGMRPEFKEAMDTYESFYDEYCEFMTNYDENSSDMSLILKYGKMVAKLAEMDAKFDAWDESEMNDAELKYYAEVSGRITQKLIDAAL